MTDSTPSLSQQMLDDDYNYLDEMDEHERLHHDLNMLHMAIHSGYYEMKEDEERDEDYFQESYAQIIAWEEAKIKRGEPID